jgi:hypothetical protein
LMNITPKQFFSLTALIITLFSSISFAQVTSSTSGNDTRTQAVAQAEDAVNKVLLDSGILFREGLLAYEDNHLPEAGEKFNKSVEVFLYSTLNIQRDTRLQGCYNQLIETVYRIEFPADNQLPQVRNLTQTCSWNDLGPR